uniref:long-chain-fatty-acid--CoA ligase n=2 Tax=Schistocephalus solidus TaxID=70667 RepID=A0A0X3NXW6_SCHSO
MESGKKNRQEPCPADESELLLICYTSGTTGLPKGVTLTNREILGTIAGMVKQTPELVSDDAVHLAFLPLAHVYEQLVELLVLYSGGRIGFSLGGLPTLMQDIVALRPTLFVAVPRLLNRLYGAVHSKISSRGWEKTALEWAVDSQLTLADKQIYYHGTLYDKLIFSKIRQLFGGNLKAVITGSAAMSSNVLRFTRALFNCPVIEGYGCTEACGVLTISVAGDLNGGHVGTPIPSVVLKLTDVPEMGIVAARDNKGEICWKSVGGTPGYYKSPEATADLIDQHGWMHTGDIGTWVNDCLKIVDRCKHIFKLSQGEYVAPEKVELVYQESLLISNVFVDGSPLSSFPVAIIVPDKQGVLRALNENGKNFNNCALRTLCESSLVKTLIYKDCIRLGEKAKLRGFEKVRNIHLTPRAFTVENGLLTPTLKASRHAIRRCYSKELVLLQKEPMS